MQLAPHRPLDATGVAHALIAYGVWGFAPIYWKVTAAFPPSELLAYRVVSSLAVAVVLTLVARVVHDLRAVLRSARATAAVALACLLLATNWLVFIHAVQTDRILETSLGYYINPLVNVVFGLGLLGERLTRAQGIAVGVAASGVAFQTWQQGELPWISLVLAVSFALYGLVRKLAPARPLAGFGLEMLLMAPIALGYLWLLDARGESSVTHASVGMGLLVAASGLITAAPLLAFASAANRLPLSSLGMFQFLAPTLAFLIAVLAYGEPFTPGHAVSFGSVWLALALFSWDALQRTPRPPDVAAAAPPLYPGELEGSTEVDP